MHGSQDKDLATATLALNMYRHLVRRLLVPHSGYECQEADGEFMLAFSAPMQAVLFCLQVHLWALLPCQLTLYACHSHCQPE